MSAHDSTQRRSAVDLVEEHGRFSPLPRFTPLLALVALVTLVAQMGVSGSCALIDAAGDPYDACESHEDCTLGFCTPEGCIDPYALDVEAASCSYVSDCEGGDYHPTCTSELAPLGGCVCLGGYCAYPDGACSDNEDCGPGAGCAFNTHRCYHFFECGLDSDCRDGDLCSIEGCRDADPLGRTCGVSTDCGGGGTCINGNCWSPVATCTTSAECDSGQYCSRTVGSCMRRVYW